ncbi:uncharacterized protein LOC129730077 [Wyeomyia smithii]|uniref:uncharacterized protein LOC129730077 n=1 Tax=Wyeomyia smithii TaxID=174621 RepID=UPI002467C243|nr:uncharacterized protein LOC129730077 [Wyeomyia smithii]
MNIIKTCGFCQHPANLMCSRCLEVYCSVECQIRDWSEHKKICVSVPKLYPNDNYLDILAGGVGLPLRSSSIIEQASSRMLVATGGRSLKPMRKPNIPIGTVEVSVNRKSISKFVDTDGKASGDETAKNISITASTSDCIKRYSSMKIEEIPRAGPNPSGTNLFKGQPEPNQEKLAQQQVKPASPEVQKPQTLANLKLEIIKHHQMMSKTAEKVVRPELSSQQKPWLEPFPLEIKDGEPFEVIIQCLVGNKPNRVWVIMASHETECEKLLRNIQAQLNPKGETLSFDQVNVDDIYAAPYGDGIYYRAVILEKIGATKGLVKIRLIDYGDELTLPASDLLPPLLLMKNLRAFAFQVEVQHCSHQLELLEHIRIKVIRSEQDCKIVEMEQFPCMPHLLEIISKGEEKIGNGGIISVFSSRKSLVMLSTTAVKAIMKVVCSQLVEAAPKFSILENPKVGDLVCINTAEAGWSRGLIIDQHGQSNLVYTIDNGGIEYVQTAGEMRVLPNEYKLKPRLVVQMEIVKVLMNELEFKRMCYLPRFGFSFTCVEYDSSQILMNAVLKDVEGKITLAEVVFSEFVCDLKQVGINYWPHFPQDKSVVQITAVLDLCTVIICPQTKINIYTELLQTILPELKVLCSAPKTNDVIIGVDDIMMPYRARVLQTVSATEVELLDLDNGCIKKHPYGKLYAANSFIHNLPVYTFKVHIRDMNPSAIVNEAVVLEQMEDFKTNKRNFRLLFEGGSYMHGVKMIDVNSNRSLATVLMEQHDRKMREAEEAEAKKREREAQEAARQEQAETAAREAAEREHREEEQAKKAVEEAAAERKRLEEAQLERAREDEKKQKTIEVNPVPEIIPVKYTINDLQLLTLPTNKTDVKLTILDDGDLNKGLLTVCELNDTNIEQYQTIIEKVNSHVDVSGDGYAPEDEELCVAVFDADKQWYRAVCLQRMPDQSKFIVQFIDFGNVVAVERKFVRKLPRALNFPCAAHTCKVKDYTKILNTLAQQQSEKGYLVAKVIELEGDVYNLKF